MDLLTFYRKKNEIIKRIKEAGADNTTQKLVVDILKSSIEDKTFVSIDALIQELSIFLQGQKIPKSREISVAIKLVLTNKTKFV